MTAIVPPCVHRAGLLLTGGAGGILAFWLLGLYPLPHHHASLTSPFTALAFFLLAPVFYLSPGQRRTLIALIYACLLVVVTGFLLNFSADWLSSSGTRIPGISLPTAVVISISALTLLLRQLPWKTLLINDIVGSFVFFAGIAFLLGHLFGAPFSQDTAGYLGVGFPTACFTLLTGFLLIASQHQGGIASLFISHGQAGLLLRRILLPMMFLLPTIALIRLKGQEAGWYGLEEGLAYMNTAALALIFLIGITAAFRAKALEREKQQAEDAEQDQMHLMRSIIENSATPIFVKDAQHRYLLVNHVVSDVLKTDPENIVGHTDAELLPAEMAASLCMVENEIIASGKPKTIEKVIPSAQGERVILCKNAPLHDRNGHIIGVVGIGHDITERKAYEAELATLSTHDKLTGLPNHNLLVDRLKQCLANTDRGEGTIVVACFDLDDFHLINEEISYEAGNELLQVVAERIGHCIRRSDTLARVYGDEFVVLLPEARDKAWAEEIMARILAAIHQPWQYAGEEIQVTASGGISFYPDNGDTAEALLGAARRALEKAKSLGKAQLADDTQTPQPKGSPRRLDKQRELQRAIDNDEFVLHYQPKIELRSGRVIGAEALIRWQHPEKGLIPPADFIPLAEHSGLIVPISELALQHTCATLKHWQQNIKDAPPIAVNLSPRHLQLADMHRRLTDVLEKTGTQPKAIDFEVTETAILRDSAITANNLRHLSEAGSRISLDDFGTGYSSLSLLRMFPIDSLKIDRSFVNDLVTDANAATIIRTVIGMARSLELSVIAEGVETAEQLRYLSQHGCHQMQGYLFSKPLPAEQFGDMLQQAREMRLADYGITTTRTLLLVDDEPGVLSALKRMLRRESYRILTAQNAEEGLKVLKENDVQVVVCDQRMPGMSGVELLGLIRERHPTTIRIVLSGYTELSSVIAAVNRGAVYKFLTKPWNDDELREQINDAFLQHDAKYRN